MRKTKLLLVAFLAMLGSSVSAAEYEIDEKLTSVAALDGKLFAIVDETDLKAFCFGYGENGWDMFYKAYNDGDAQSAKACYFKLSAASGDGPSDPEFSHIPWPFRFPGSHDPEDPHS